MKTKTLGNDIYYFLISLITLAVIFLVLFSASLQGEIVNQDKPEKGTGTFNITELWQVSEGEGNPFGNIRAILVSKDGILCCLDDRLKRLFLFNKDGKMIKGFGKEGEGPGEIKLFRQARLHNAGNKIAVQDTDKLHYYNWDGDYIESKHNLKARGPILFLSEYEFITAPNDILSAPDGIANVKKINLVTGKETLVTSFSMYKGGAIQSGNNSASLIASGITPLFELGIHGDRLYYGVSDKYKIYISGIDGKAFDNFTLIRKKISITDKEKVDPIIVATKGLAPEELIKTLALKLPNEQTYYTDIQSHNDLIFVFVSKWNRDYSIQTDIFSPDGKYLYKKFVKVDAEYKIEKTPIINGDYLYLVLQNEDDEFILAKYKIDLPE